MSKISLIIMLPVLSLLTVGSYTIDKFNSLLNTMEGLQAANIMLKKDKRLLKKKVRNLKQKQSRIKNKLKARRSATAKKKILRIEQKIAKAPVQMLPWVGAAVIASSTIYEVNEICKELENDRQFEKDLFDEIQTSDVSNESQLCSMDFEKELRAVLDEQLKDTKHWMDESYINLSDTSEMKLSEYKEYIKQYYNDFYGQGSTKLREYSELIKTYLPDSENNK